MNKIIEIIKNNWTYIIGGIVGGIGGYIYWYRVGCSGGTCPITSSPVMSTLWGMIFGGLLFSIIFVKKSKKPANGLTEPISSGALILDVRTPGEYAGGHIQNSINIPLDELGASMHKLNKEQNIVVVCASGMRSTKAVKMLKNKGFQNCHNGGSWVNYQ
jgi:rhodanese-related sulfurtransferase